MNVGELKGRATEAATTLDRKVRARLDARRIVSRANLFELEAAGWAGVRPAFVLSTGRSGTRLLADLLERTKAADVHHAPTPELITASGLAYARIEAPGELGHFVELLKASREDMLRHAVRYGKQYVEPNCRITFFAPACDAAYPGSRFLHIVRHPAAIIRSGAERGWYSGRHDHDSGRIVPRSGTPEAEAWGGWSQVERIGWLWAETCQFVERFATGREAEIDVTRAEDIFGDAGAMRAAMAACGVEPLACERVEAAIAKPVNAQADGSFPRWRDWSDADRARLIELAGPTAARYGYDLGDASSTRPRGAITAPGQRPLVPR